MALVVAVVAVVAVSASASASAAAAELADFSPARWEYPSLLFPRFQISPRRARARLASFWSALLIFLAYASPQNFEFPSFCQAHLVATAGTGLRDTGTYTAILRGSELDEDSHIVNNLRVNEDPI
jgi:hypothetical protein